MSVHSTLPPSALLATTVLLACSSDFSVPEFEPQVIEETTFDPSLGIDLSQMTKSSSGLYIQVLQEGEGEPAAPGATASVNYTGRLTDATVFDTGTYEFELGANQAIAGFDEGVTGMRLGEQRRVIIPPALAYGDAGRGIIAPGSILIFDLELTQLLSQ